VIDLEQIIEQAVERAIERRFGKQAGADSGPALVTIEQYADARSISTTTVRAAIRCGRLPATYFGRAVRVPRDVEIGTTLPPAPAEGSIPSPEQAAVATLRRPRKAGRR
jgi:excisionase family DNA binding protein